ncbi:penicillin-binding protein [Candidatus Saccharibacteria bacterium]|nr:MAG: penicillin-binding protein [Candidatus Saccharibacteria bacterium]
MKQLESNRPRRTRAKSNTFTTRSGKSIKVNRSLNDRLKAGREAKARRKAAYLSSLPANPWKRFFYRISPKRVAKYWFSRQGALMALKITGICFVVGFLLLVGVFAYFRKDLPKINDISGNTFGGSITYYDRTGTVLLYQDYDAKKRVPVADDKIAEVMKQATLAIEDRNFFEHGAFDTKGIARAAVNEVKGGSGGRQGGSTITQQLVKLSEGWENERTVSRKIKELILAVELEREYSKKEILTGYLNMAPYGNVNYGVETAAQDYFGVSAKDLSLAQAAMLAAIPKAPGSLSPYSSPEFNKSLGTNYFDKEWLLERQVYILDIMIDEKYITKQQADEAKKVDILAQVKPRQDKYTNIKAPYFVLAARDELYRTFPKGAVDNGGWKVTTSIDMDMQALAEKSMADGRARLTAQRAEVGAFVAEDNDTGQIVALVGGWGLDTPGYGENNYASQMYISPGSSIKPYNYLTFIDNNKNVGAGSVLYDTQGPIAQYTCTNKSRPPAGNCLFDFDRRYPGPMTIRYALGGSRNVPAVKAFTSAVPNDTSPGRTTSMNKVISTIDGLMDNPDGYRCFKDETDLTRATKADEQQCYASAGIGDGAYLHLDDHVHGIASISRLGKTLPKTYLLKVTNASGKTLKEFKQPEGKQIVKPDSAYIVNDMASDPGASYLGNNCNEQGCSGLKFHRYKGWKIAIKTGTTNDLLDGMMVSWSKKYSAGIWVGNHTRTVPYVGQPENMTAPIMKQFMQGAHDRAGAPDNWKEPAGIKTAPAFVNRSKNGAGQIVPSRATDLFPSWYVGKAASTNEVLDKVSNKLATSCTPPLAKQTSANSNAAGWNVDVFSGGNTGGSAPATGNDDIHNCNDAKPSASITAINGASTDSQAGLTCPADGCSIMVRIDQGTHALTDSNRPSFPGTIALLVNGQSVQSQGVSASGDYQFTYVPSAGSTGAAEITVQVTDSVLYQGTDTTSVTVSVAETTTTSSP